MLDCDSLDLFIPQIPHFGNTASGGRRPLELKYSYPSSLGHVVSEYIWLWGSISKTLGGVREQTDRQTDRQTEGQTDRQTDRQKLQLYYSRCIQKIHILNSGLVSNILSL